MFVFQYGDTALHTAARYGHAGITRILISARCNINDQNKVRMKVVLFFCCCIWKLFWACRSFASRYLCTFCAIITDDIICHCCFVMKNADTALHIAAALKRRKITKLLVEAGIMTNILNRVRLLWISVCLEFWVPCILKLSSAIWWPVLLPIVRFVL